MKNKTNRSFEKRLEPILIESNRKKYLADTTFGIRPRQALLNEDLPILERHYKGVYPRDIAYEKNNFITFKKLLLAQTKNFLVQEHKRAACKTC